MSQFTYRLVQGEDGCFRYQRVEATQFTPGSVIVPGNTEKNDERFTPCAKVDEILRKTRKKEQEESPKPKKGRIVDI